MSNRLAHYDSRLFYLLLAFIFFLHLHSSQNLCQFTKTSRSPSVQTSLLSMPRWKVEFETFSSTSKLMQQQIYPEGGVCMCVLDFEQLEGTEIKSSVNWKTIHVNCNTQKKVRLLHTGLLFPRR